MDSNKKSILVTWDFTLVSEYALEHAIRISKIVDNNIALIHIIKKKSDAEEAIQKMTTTAEKIHAEHNIKPTIIVKEGTIFTTIGKIATEIDANLVIMGTHGIKGMQKLTGSWALKVIVSSKVPFIVVQSPPGTNHFNNIVFPVDFRLENKEKLSWVNYLAKYYRSKISIFKENITDSILKKRTNNNLIFAKKIMDSKNINYSISTAEGKESFPDETIKFAQESNADLILVMTTRNIGIKDFVIGANEQQIIANSAKIPVMCINPRDDLRKISGFR
jgi:nucleotide-binding universal stress UspA family protein